MVSLITKQLTHQKQIYIFWLLLLAGAILRIRQYFSGRSLWLDEAALVNNITGRTIGQLLTQPLEGDQIAAPGMLIAIKVVGSVLGYEDILLRLVPLGFGLCALVVVFFLVTHFRTFPAQLCLTSLFSFAPVLIYYSSEVKQYSADVFFSLLLIWVGLIYRQIPQGRVVLFAAGLAGVLFSQPAVFLLATISIIDGIQAIRTRDVGSFARIASMALLWLLIFALAYAPAMRQVINGNGLTSMWAHAFAPFPWGNGARWYLEQSLGLAYLGFSPPTPVSFGKIASWSTPLNIAIWGAMFAGVVSLYLCHRRWFMLATMTILANLIVSGFNLYPFGSRPAIYLIPILFIFLAGFVDGIGESPVHLLRRASAVLMLGLATLVIIPAAHLAFKPAIFADMKGALEYVLAHHKPSDSFSVSNWSYPAYRFYNSHGYSLGSLNELPTIPSDFDLSVFRYTICASENAERTWLIFTHRIPQAQEFAFQLAQQALILDTWEGPGASVYLADMKTPGFCK